MKELGRSLNADDMGLGKSLQSLCAAYELDAFPCLIVCPASLKINWQRQIREHLGTEASVLSGTSPEAKRKKVSDLTVVNYDILKERMDELLGIKAKCVIVDEGHYLQNRSSKRTKLTKVLGKVSEHCFILSGTPITGKPADLWPLLNVLRGDLFPSFFSFCHKFARPKKNPWGWSYAGAKNLGELNQLLKDTVLVRRLKSEVLKDLPPKRKIVVPMELQDRRSYEGAKKDFLSWLVKNKPEKLSGAARAEGLSLANHLKQLVGKLKLPYVIEWAENFLEGGGGKLILFAYHREVVEALNKGLKRSVKVYGGLSDKRRQEAFDAFNNDARINVLIGQIESAGQGWSCTSSSTCAFAELDWRAHLIDQATDRTHGVKRGSGGLSTSYFLLAHSTIEEALAQAIDRKQSTARQALDGGEGEVLDVFGRFCEIMKGGK